MKNLHKKIRELRKKHKISQSEISEKLNFHVSHYNRIENGKAIPSLEAFKSIVDFFEVSSDYLLQDNVKTYETKIKSKSLQEKLILLDELDANDSKAMEQLLDSLLIKNKTLKNEM